MPHSERLRETERSVRLGGMRRSKKSREQIIGELMPVFRGDSFSGASLAELAAAVGLGKASLYQKFPDGKAQMGAEVLDQAGRWMETEVLTPLEQAGDPIQKFKAMLNAVDTFYEGGQMSCLLNTFSLGEAGKLYRDKLADSIRRWREGLAALALRAGLTPKNASEWAEEVLLNIQGALVLSRAEGDPGVFQRTLKRLHRRGIA
jgi:TetR/AcrR family transcriptional regulator, lmrAB and yxaGH operons repressor